MPTDYSPPWWLPFVQAAEVVKVHPEELMERHYFWVGAINILGSARSQYREWRLKNPENP